LKKEDRGGQEGKNRQGENRAPWGLGGKTTKISKKKGKTGILCASRGTVPKRGEEGLRINKEIGNAQSGQNLWGAGN